MSRIFSRLPLLLHGSLAAFGAYFCMYAYRKPFTVARFDGIIVWGIDYKIALIVVQVIGYAISKFVGIKLISELKPFQRKRYFILLILSAELSLIAFAWIPAPWNIIFMLLNGLPLGLIWGIVFSYLEGRKFTEILGVMLCASFIVSSGTVKSIGLWVVQVGVVSEFWMPAVTGAIFLLPLLFFIALLEKIPAPDQEDIALRSKRVPMNRVQRKILFRQFAAPLSLLILFYVILSAFRDLRDNFARELWSELGFNKEISVYSCTEIIIALMVVVVLGSLFLVKENRKALFAYHITLLAGVICVGLSTFLFEGGRLHPFTWMVGTGLGLYICYVPFNALFFDRFVATFKVEGNAGYLIYLADSFGYLGSVVALLCKNFALPTTSWLRFFCNGAYILSFTGIVILIFSIFNLKQKYTRKALQQQWELNTI